MKRILISAAMITLFAFNGDEKITGTWVSRPSVKGNTTRVVMKADNSFEGFINNKPFVSGTYTFSDSIFSFVDNGCAGVRGVYKTIFFSNSDSLRFEAISDSCTDRRNGMIRLVMGRLK